MKRFLAALALLALLACGGCSPSDGEEPSVETNQKIEEQAKADPNLRALLDRLSVLKARHVAELKNKADKLYREQERQKSVRHWLIVVSVGLLGGFVLGLAGKLITFFSLGAGMVGVVLAWIGGRIQWRELVVGGIAGLACVAAAIWLDSFWAILLDFGRLAIGSVVVFATWQLASRYYTGKWDTIGDDVKPRR